GPIALRVVTLRDEAVSSALLAARVQQAAALRARVVPDATDAYRLLHGEGDGLPGVVCDVYGAFAVLKTDGAGPEAWRDLVTEVLRPALSARGVATLLARRRGRDRAPDDGAKTTVLYGAAPPARLTVREHGVSLLVDLARGQKT